MQLPYRHVMQRVLNALVLFVVSSLHLPSIYRFITKMTSRKRSSDSQGHSADATAHTKKTKVSTEGESTGKIDANGDRYWEISKMRRVTISSFRGKTMVNVREYYEKDGQELPGKKVSSPRPKLQPHGVGSWIALMPILQGISMPMDQFSALIKLLPDIAQALEEKGESLPRPMFSGDTDRPDNASDEEHVKTAKSASPSKQNIEATSDEESEA